MEQKPNFVTFQLPQDYEDEKETRFLGNSNAILICMLAKIYNAVNFSNGQLRPSVRGKPKFTLYQKAKDHSRKKRLIVAETDRMTYIGSNYDPESFTSGSTGTKWALIIVAMLILTLTYVEPPTHAHTIADIVSESLIERKEQLFYIKRSWLP